MDDQSQSAGISSLSKMKSIGTRFMDCVDLLLRCAIIALAWTVPLFVLFVLPILVFQPLPNVGGSLQPWLLHLLIAVFAGTYIAIVVGHLYLLLIRKQTLSAFIESTPRLRAIRQGFGRVFWKVDGVLDKSFGALGRLAGKLFLVLLGAAAILAAMGVAIWAFGAAFSSAPWWAIVIIVLLVLILLK